jgi:hypothetical protein
LFRLPVRSVAPAVLALGLAAAPLCAATPRGLERPFPAGSTAVLRGLPVSAATSANLGFVNLAPAANRCSLAIARPDGSALVAATTWTLRAFEERPFLDAFAGLAGASAGVEANVTVSCAGAFSTFAVLADRRGQALRTVAAEQIPSPLAAADKIDECGTGAICFDAPGIVHEPGPPPGPPDPVGRVAFAAPALTAKRFVLSLDVKVGPWFPDEPSGKHLIYWFVIDKNLDMPGLLYFLGPGRDEAFARHGIHLTHPQKIKVIKHWAAQVGRTYHVVNDYDMGRKRYTVTITDAETGEVQVVLKSRPNVTSYVLKPGASFLVDMGFYPGRVDGEVPSYGWIYRDLHVELYK